MLNLCIGYIVIGIILGIIRIAELMKVEEEMKYVPIGDNDFYENPIFQTKHYIFISGYFTITLWIKIAKIVNRAFF